MFDAFTIFATILLARTNPANSLRIMLLSAVVKAMLTDSENELRIVDHFLGRGASEEGSLTELIS